MRPSQYASVPFVETEKPESMLDVDAGPDSLDDALRVAGQLPRRGIERLGHQAAVLDVQQMAGGVLGTARRFDEQLGLAAIDRRHVDPGQIAEQEVLSIGQEKGWRGPARRSSSGLASGSGRGVPPDAAIPCRGTANGRLIHDLTVDAPGRATRLRCVGERLRGAAVERDALSFPSRNATSARPSGEKAGWRPSIRVRRSPYRAARAPAGRPDFEPTIGRGRRHPAPRTPPSCHQERSQGPHV